MSIAPQAADSKPFQRAIRLGSLRSIAPGATVGRPDHHGHELRAATCAGVDHWRGKAIAYRLDRAELGIQLRSLNDRTQHCCNECSFVRGIRRLVLHESETVHHDATLALHEFADVIVLGMMRNS